MTEVLAHFQNTAQTLRAEFDRSFAEPAQLRREATDDIVHLIVAGDHYAMRITEILGLQADRRIVELPKRTPEFMGVSSFRGEIVPVYSLRQILGYGPGAAGRWTAVTRTENVFGLEFERFEGHVRVARTSVVAATGADNSRHFIRDVAHVGTVILPIISIAALFETVKQFSGV